MPDNLIKPSKVEQVTANIPGITTKREKLIHFLRVFSLVLLVLAIFVGIFIGLIKRTQVGPPDYQNPRNLITTLVGHEVTIDVLTQLAIALGLTIVIALIGILFYTRLKNGNNN